MTQDAVPGSARSLLLDAVLVGATARGLVLRLGSGRRRQRLQVCTAARLLTILGARVHVLPPPVPWPRSGGRLVATHAAGRLGDLALLMAVPRTVAGWTELADRVLPLAGAGSPAADDGRVLCPVTVACRTATGPLHRIPRHPAAIAALRDLVIEVRLLAPVVADDVGVPAPGGTSEPMLRRHPGSSALRTAARAGGRPATGEARARRRGWAW